MADGWTVQLTTGRETYKIFRLWFGQDGSYYVTAPYHSAREAIAFIATVYYDRAESKMERQNFVRTALFDDEEKRLKMAHHPDGLLQFSGTGVTSGLTQEGRPKGLGLRSFELRRPPKTGSSFTCAVHGIEQFETGDPDRTDALVFEEGAIPPVGGESAFVFEAVCFAEEDRQFLRIENREWVIGLAHPRLRTVMTFRALLPPPDCELQTFIGLRAFRYRGGGVADQPSGFLLSGPSGNVRLINGERMSDGLYCVYPPTQLDRETVSERLEYPGQATE